MKRILFAMLSAVITAVSHSLALAAVAETTLDGISVYVGSAMHISEASTEIDENGNDLRPYIMYADDEKEYLTNNYTALIINGSIVKNANLVIENDRTLVPLRLISETLEAKVDWDGALSKVTISNGGNVIELVINDKNPLLNGKAVQIDVAPKIINDWTYVPARFVAEALNCAVGYFDGRKYPEYDGTGVPEAHYFPRLSQVMISRYPSGESPLTAEQAIEKGRSEMIKAYEKKYGAFTRLNSEPDLSGPWSDESEQLGLQYQISNLPILSENDRFVITNMVWDFWIDKYTGSVFTFYNGDSMFISKFDPNREGAFAFAG
jgi:hypothetical protein